MQKARKNHLLAANLVTRLAITLILGAGLLLAAWSIGYYFLPEGLFRGGADARMAHSGLGAPSASTVEEWGKIFRANLIPAMIIVLGSVLLRVNGIPFGYLACLYNIVSYGLYLGTNSFAVLMPARLSPSLEILQRSGPYEMLALVLLAAACSTWSFFEIKQLFRTNPSRVRPAPKIVWVEVGGVVLGIIFLAAANWREAAMVMAITAP